MSHQPPLPSTLVMRKCRFCSYQKSYSVAVMHPMVTVAILCRERRKEEAQYSSTASLHSMSLLHKQKLSYLNNHVAGDDG